ncbi:MAG: ABC transporter ATP-binding protein [Dysgonamonadaceae bacterium]|jgi:ABC-2 type transport system ATP-binding protein|nr:ABC transporter ATP-binding protein [Dysgonamonadaceae bacterium]
MILELKNISKSYGSRCAVNKLSFSIDKGEIVGFLGPNGAGKSTAMKIITGVQPADEGSVTINGVDLRKNPLEAKSHTGFLPEDNPLYTDMYVSEYLEYVAGIYSLKNRKEAVGRILSQTGLDSEANKKIEQLSKGYKQRVGLAQAIIHRPDLLILDEPTSGLDPIQTEEIHRLLLSIGANKGILFSSHTLSEVETVCTRILLLHKGKIKADIPRSEIGDLKTLFKELTAQQ